MKYIYSIYLTNISTDLLGFTEKFKPYAVFTKMALHPDPVLNKTTVPSMNSTFEQSSLRLVDQENASNNATVSRRLQHV